MTLEDGKLSQGVSLIKKEGAKKHILIVCGEPRILAGIKMGLRDCFEVSIAAASGSAVAALDSYGADAVVIYIGEDSGGAFSMFEDISAHSAGAPVLFLAENDDESDEAAALRMGAADYCVRRRDAPRSGSALGSRIDLRIRAAENERCLNGEGIISAESPEAFLAGKTILIAEDIELNQKVIEAMLSGIRDLTVEFADNGKEAVEKFKQNPGLYSLIFMDVYMPEMDGLSAARTIRRLDCENARSVPIIALTASVSEDDITNFPEAGMNGYLEKPMDYEQFLSTCAKFCAR